MKRVLSGLAAAVLLLAAGQAAAATPPPVQNPSMVQAADEAERWLAEVAVWSEGYDAVLTSRVDTVLWLMDSTEALIGQLEQGDKGGARAWGVKWGAEARRRLSAEVDAFNQLPAAMPAFPASLPLAAEDRRRLDSIRLTPQRIGGLLETTNAASETYVRLMETAAASGKPEDLDALGAGIFGLLAANLEAEIVMVEGAQDPNDGPTYYFSEANIAGNRGLAVWMRHAEAVLFEQPSNPEEAARGVRKYANEIRSAVQRMQETSAAEVRGVRGLDELDGTGLAEVMEATFASYSQSAEVEAEVADALDDLADAILSGEDADPVLARIETLTNRRIEIDTARRRLLAARAS